MIKGVIVRKLESGDIPRVAEILVEGFKDKFGPIFGPKIEKAPRIVAQDLAREERYRFEGMFVAEEEGKVVGTLGLKSHKDGLGDFLFALRLFWRELGWPQAPRALLGFYLLATPVAEDEAYIEYIAVAAGHRGRGLGRALLAKAEEWARQRGKRCLSLHVSATNTRARSLYERFGFVEKKTESLWLTEWLFGIRKWIYMVKPLNRSALG